MVAIAAVIWPAPRLVAQGSDPPAPPLSPTDVACAPRVSSNPLQSEPRVIGSQDEFAKSYFAPSDTLVIDGGRLRGMDVGQEYFVFGLQTTPEIVAGQRVNVFRKGNTRHEWVATVGEAVVVHIDHETTSATARLLTAREAVEAVEAGDQIALHR